MENLLYHIQKTNEYGLTKNSEKKVFNEHLTRWHNEANAEHYNENFFVANGKVSREDIEKAIAYQKDKNIHHFLLKMTQPLDEAVIQEFKLEEDHTYVMVLLDREKSINWRCNDTIIVKDCQQEDIYEDLLEDAVTNCPEEYRPIVAKSMTAALNDAKADTNYHWFAAYLNGKIVGSAYALCHDGCMEFDDLVVRKEYRNRYIATTIMKYIAENFKETICLHAAVNKTPKDMYAKMGFEIVATSYEYFLEWE